MFAVAVAVAMGAWAPGGAANAPSCASFSSQADAQERFFLLGGTPMRNPASLDDDGDGVACEGLPGPYAGYATIGYNRQKGFLYGTASMPVEADGEGFACLLGNHQFPEGTRRLKVYKVSPGPDAAISNGLKAEPRTSSGRLLWKLERDLAVAARYYAVFEPQIRLGPYVASNCPEFRTRETRLPRSPKAS